MNLANLKQLVAVTCVVAAVGACGAPQLKQPSDVVLSMQDLDCQECGLGSVSVLEKKPGIGHVEFDRKTAELHVHFDSAATNPGVMIAALRTAGEKAVLGAGTGSDVLWLSHGEAFDLTTAPVAGKVTVVDFGAKWCGPCHAIDKRLVEMLQQRTDIAVRQVDIVDWDSPVAAQQLHNIEGLPYVLVFNRSGKRVAATPAMTPEALATAVAAATKDAP